ncbi:DUF493 domain-containing protein [uncultured Campylobacter sp.]|uniref:HP0495 family protein n=1 Tax=uncultured Campylobacter sp. TaxID=218934 RepID=UPI002632AD54|nr:DUF493 domain-containing protein [uncultured Campylobacter sp.]
MVNLNELKQKPIINYPSFWEYKIILEQDENAKAIVKKILLQREFKLSESNNSKNGKYKSYLLKILVDSESDRLAIFELLKKHSKFVL